MPTDHLEWTEITDFSKGLWTRDSAFLMPSDGFQTMTDCYPQPGGGLRAFFATTDATGTSFPASGEKVVALSGIAASVSSLVDTQWLCITRVTSTGGLKAYYQAHGSDAWSLVKTFDAPTTVTPGDLAEVYVYETAAGVKLWAVGVFSFPNGAAGSTDGGTWTYTPGGAWSQISSTQLVKTVYQQRLFVVLTNTLYWTDPGGTTFPAANYLELDVGFRDISSTPAALVAFSPNTLLVPTSGGTWISIEGSISDPIVREMGRGHYLPVNGLNPTAYDDDGIVFYEPDHGIYLAQNMGSTFSRMDSALEPADWELAEPFNMISWDHFILVPGGRVYDKETSAWFTSTDLANISTWFPDGGNYTLPGLTLYGGKFSDPPGLVKLITGVDGTRKTTYTVKTSPLQGQGRQVAVREIVVAYKSFHASSTIAVTVGGTTVTSSALAVGAGVYRFRFAKRDEYLDVQVVPNSNTSSEAPLIEAVVIGTRKDSHYVT